MNTKKYTNNLQKSSGLFLQLGLVLTLLTTYLALELKTEQRVATVIETQSVIDDVYTFVPVIKIERKKAKTKVTKTSKKRVASTNFVVNNTPTTPEDLPFIPEDPDKKNPIDNGFPDFGDEDEGDVLEDDTHLMINVDEVPVFPGCEKVKESKRRACFEKKIHKHIQKKFNSNLAPQLGLSSGKKRIFIEFIITKTGDIEITNANAPHSRLKKEGKRVVNKLPTMIPGKQNGEAVNVKYTLPIVFNVE